jgi:hypothetical protein
VMNLAAGMVHVVHASAPVMACIGNIAGDDEDRGGGGQACYAIAKPQAGFGTHPYHYAPRP